MHAGRYFDSFSNNIKEFESNSSSLLDSPAAFELILNNRGNMTIKIEVFD